MKNKKYIKEINQVSFDKNKKYMVFIPKTTGLSLEECMQIPFHENVTFMLTENNKGIRVFLKKNNKHEK